MVGHDLENDAADMRAAGKHVIQQRPDRLRGPAIMRIEAEAIRPAAAGDVDFTDAIRRRASISPAASSPLLTALQWRL